MGARNVCLHGCLTGVDCSYIIYAIQKTHLRVVLLILCSGVLKSEINALLLQLFLILQILQGRDHEHATILLISAASFLTYSLPSQACIFLSLCTVCLNLSILSHNGSAHSPPNTFGNGLSHQRHRYGTDRKSARCAVGFSMVTEIRSQRSAVLVPVWPGVRRGWLAEVWAWGHRIGPRPLAYTEHAHSLARLLTRSARLTRSLNSFARSLARTLAIPCPLLALRKR